MALDALDIENIVPLFLEECSLQDRERVLRMLRREIVKYETKTR